MDEKTTQIDDVFRLFDGDLVHVLTVTFGARQGRRFEIGTEPLLLGRAADAPVQLPDGGVSSRHCVVRRKAGDVSVEDLGSTNGTYVDGVRVEGTVRLPIGSVLQVGNTLLTLELRSRKQIEAQDRMQEELDRAAAYVRSLLPAPIRTGKVRTEWCFIPSAHLGGDAFGYHWLDGGRLAVYLLDVCGHGAGAALHSVSVINVIRKGSLLHVDFGDPSEVLAALNATFPMEDHGGMYFTIWYGVYEVDSGRVAYSSAGHPPALLVSPGREAADALTVRSFPTGMLEDSTYETREAEIPSGSRLYLFSDGVYEIRTDTGWDWSLPQLTGIVEEPPLPGRSEPDRIESAVRERMRGKDFYDDFSLLVLEFE